ncbi:MAG: class I SAM-dependent methyltransferase [Acidobacteriota bacterium]|nr:class I SAM-dependent methyltransferase [Acidobacteriota bacterium]
MTIGEIAGKAAAFRVRLDQVKARLGPQDFEWYRYDSLANLHHIERLLTAENRDLGSMIGEKPVLDIGCADGDLAFFFESLGCRVTAIDYPVTNHNHMAGVRKMKDALGSKVEILAMDVDTQFTLTERDFGLALVLGAIYHLKNPLYLLETVSRHARHALLSTRVARRIPGLPGSAKDVPLAYLLGADELNEDNSNYWIFTEAGFRRMLERTNWQVLDLTTFGDVELSDPVHVERDERVFCLARSCFAMANVELLEGWHEAEGAGWRWTAQRFSARVRVPRGAARAQLRMKIYLPEDLLARWGSVTIRPREGAAETYRESGYHELIRDLGPQDGGIRLLEFTLNHAVPADAADYRELGVIVHSIEVL